MYIIVLVTTKNVREANRIATKLVKDKSIACANVVKGVKSIFWWQKKVNTANEVLLILKAKKSCFKKIVKTVTLLHNYEVPEIIALPIIDGSRDYFKWIEESCSS
ncbi:MAG: divalent-cation tolerance protein CutA [Candidatus Omnitrophica bacterium]|nr:divalent-cation tolerance protein CutA [Candidatus Omnitrophota bacterium]